MSTWCHQILHSKLKLKVVIETSSHVYLTVTIKSQHFGNKKLNQLSKPPPVPTDGKTMPMTKETQPEEQVMRQNLRRQK